ncbi:MAG TPA: PTS sugar transporter subunit IIA [Nitrospirota bacterium]|jgi:PTS system nitrogen regulatory IIA component
MKISDLIVDGLVIEDLAGGSKLEVLREFARLLYDSGKVPDKEGLTQVLVARESLGSTGIGDGVAIPHGKLKGLKEMVLAFGRSRAGVDFDSLDGEPAHLFFMLVAPEDAPGDHLKALARISRLMKNREVRESLMKAADAKDLRRVLVQGEEG